MILAISLTGCTGPSVQQPDASAALAYLQAEATDPDDALLAFQAAIGTGADGSAWAALLELPDSYGDLLRLVHALASHGLDPSDFRGTDLVQQVWDAHDGQQFGSPASIVDDAWALVALDAAGAPRNDPRWAAAVQMLLDAQAPDGGWSWDGGPAGSTDETAWVLEALAVAGAAGAAAEEALDFLSPAEDGSFATAGVGPNCQSTGLAARAYQAIGAPPPTALWGYLTRCQNADGGFAHMPGGPSQVWVTADVLPGLG